MNFLAHLYLSGDDPEIKIGNFIGDFVKGRNLRDRYPPGVARGIELHRSIDEFTDLNEVVQQSKDRLRPKYRHYSGVIVDVFYDHFLASLWPNYHQEPLETFAKNSYRLIRETEIELPRQVGYMLKYMERGNWLVNYAKVDGIDQALTGMSHRTPYESKMDEASVDLEKNYDEYKDEFEAFFPQLKIFCEEWITAN
jgi:acyl carrier protein phosphodiesterase